MMLRLSVLSLAVLFVVGLTGAQPRREKRATAEAALPFFGQVGVRQTVDSKCAALLPNGEDDIRVIECMRCALDEETFFLPGQRWRGEWNSMCVSCRRCMSNGARCTMHAKPTNGSGCKTTNNVRRRGK